MMKRKNIIIVCIIMMAIMTACSDSKNNEKSNETQAAEDTVKEEQSDNDETQEAEETVKEEKNDEKSDEKNVTDDTDEEKTDVDLGDNNNKESDENESDVNAVELYAEILREKGMGHFKLIYVDEDDIPELAYIEGNGAHLDQVSLYTVYNGEAVYLDNFGIYGTLVYSEKNNRIFGYTGMDENEELEAMYTYMIENGEIQTAPDHTGYTTDNVIVFENTYDVDDSNIEKMLNGELE